MIGRGPGSDGESTKPDSAPTRAAATFDATSDHYDDPANWFRDRFGWRTVERLNLAPGARVLDVCCGSGAATIPAAEVVGPQGFVLGVDLAENLLALGRKKAEQRALTNVQFRAGDMMDLGLPESDFDVVTCVFGIFFVPEMSAAVRALWRLVAPGGTLAIVSWGPRQYEPMISVFWESVRAVRPDLRRVPNPWDHISEPEAVRALLAEAGADCSEAVLEIGTHPLRSPDDWWALVLGSRYRGTVEALDESDRERVRRENLEYVQNAGVREIETNVIYASAVKRR